MIEVFLFFAVHLLYRKGSPEKVRYLPNDDKSTLIFNTSGTLQIYNASVQWSLSLVR